MNFLQGLTMLVVFIVIRMNVYKLLTSKNVPHISGESLFYLIFFILAAVVFFVWKILRKTKC